MVMLQQNFDFSSPNKWEEWRDRFLRFRLATKLNKKKNQISSLIYAMRIEAENIMRWFGLEGNDSKSFDIVLVKFNDHYSRMCKIHQGKQRPNESAEQFIRALYKTAANYNFKESKNTQIIGIKDKDLSVRMQLKDLTLEMATTMARQSETVKSQVCDQNHDNESADKINRGARPKHLHNRGATR